MEIMDNNESIKPYEFKLFEFELVKPKSSNVMPDPRSGHRIVCTPKELYCFGGYNPNVSLASTWGGRRELWKFNFSSKIWTLVKYSNLPREIMSPAVIRRRQKLLVGIYYLFHFLIIVHFDFLVIDIWRNSNTFWINM